MAALTQKELDKFKCDQPDCPHDHSVLYLQQKCHPDASVNCRYVKATGNLHVECAECGGPVAEIKVARDSTVQS